MKIKSARIPPQHVGSMVGYDVLELLRQAEAAGRRIATIDLSACKTRQETLYSIGNALEFPAYYGANLDALHDCLTDLQAQQGLLVLLQGLSSVAALSDEERESLLDSFRDAADFHGGQHRVFQVLWN